MSQSPPILPYASPATPKPRRGWLLIPWLLPAFLVWYQPRLTPSFFPTPLDLTMLAIVAGGAFIMPLLSPLPVRAFAGIGAAAVLLFLLANFNDNNFAHWFQLQDVLAPWSVMVAAGAVVGAAAAVVTRFVARKITEAAR